MNNFYNITDRGNTVTVNPATVKLRENIFLSKAKNRAQKNNIPFYTACQNRMFGMLMSRFSKVYVKKTFIVNDGIVIRAIIDLDYSNRALQLHHKADEDFKLTFDSINSALQELCSYDCDDNTVFEIISATPTGEDGAYKFTLRGGLNTAEIDFSFIVTAEDSENTNTVVLSFVETECQ